MNKRQLVILAARKSGIPQREMAECLEPILETITDVLSQGKSITIHGFGSFQVKEWDERRSRNPKTGEIVTIPKKKVVRFKLNKAILLK